MNQSKQTLFALEDAGGQRLLPERRAYNERLAYFESRKASLEELYADFFTDYPLEGGGWFSQANIVECMTLFGRRMAAMGKLLREMYLVYSTSTMLRGGDGARLFVSESQRRRLLALAQECDDIDEVWSKNPVRERLQQQLSTPEGLQTFRQIQAKQETTSTWSSWKAWLGSWVNKKTIALVAFAYWLWWRCPTIEDGMEKKACGWAQSIVDFAWQKTKDLFHVSMGQLTEEQEKEKTSKSRWWGTGGLAVGAGVGTFACGVGSLFTAGAVGIACVAAAGTAGAGIGYVGRGTIYENNTVATNTAFLNTVTTLIVNNPEAFAVLGGSGFVKLVDMWVTKTKPIRDLNIQKTVMKKEVFDGAIGALAAHPVSHMAFQGFKKGEDQLNTWINPEHVQLQKKVREGDVGQAGTAVGGKASKTVSRRRGRWPRRGGRRRSVSRMERQGCIADSGGRRRHESVPGSGGGMVDVEAGQNSARSQKIEENTRVPGDVSNGTVQERPRRIFQPNNEQAK